MKQYLDALKQVLEQGEQRDDRTGVGTISLFGMQQRYNLDGYTSHASIKAAMAV